MYKIFFKGYHNTIKFYQKIQRLWRNLETVLKTGYFKLKKTRVFLFLIGVKNSLKIKEKYVTLGSIVVLTLILSLILSASKELKQSVSLLGQADASSLSSDLISETGTMETLHCEKTLSDASLTCFDYYANLTDAQKPDDFLNIYLVEDGEFVFGSQNTSEQIIPRVAERNQLMTYVVKKGDTLGKIAEQFGVNIETIKVANRLSVNVLQPGKELIILPVSGIYYTVAKGDTLGKIATKYKISVSTILEYNGVDEKYIKVGDKIILPGAKAVASVTKTTTGSAVTQNNTTSVAGYFIYPTTGWNWGQLHNNNAVDIASSCGTPIYAAADGIVIESVRSGWNGGYGNSIKIQHPNGTMTYYAHLSSVGVENGTSVKQGGFIGKMGTTGKSTGCHLHFEVRGGKNPFVK